MLVIKNIQEGAKWGNDFFVFQKNAEQVHLL